MSKLPKITSARRSEPPRAKSHYQTPQQVVLEISPQEIRFPNCQANKIYEHEILIRNLSRTSKRIKILQPKTSKFRVDYQSQASIAPGLFWRLTCIYECAQPGKFFDLITIQTEDNQSFQIPIVALQSQSQLEYDKHVNFGLVPVGSAQTFELKVRNSGAVPCKFELVSSHKEVAVESPGAVNPGQQRAVRVSLRLLEAGVFKSLLTVKLDGNPVREQIDVTATGLEFNQYIVAEDGLFAEQIDFGDVYFGKVCK